MYCDMGAPQACARRPAGRAGGEGIQKPAIIADRGAGCSRGANPGRSGFSRDVETGGRVAAGSRLKPPLQWRSVRGRRPMAPAPGGG